MLAAQGLLEPPAAPATKDSVLEAVRRMGALQIDTIHVVARSPYLVLWSRLGAYQPEWLDALLAERALFEYWSHAMCFLPIEDYPCYRRHMLENLRGWGRAGIWIQEHAELVERVLSHIRANGGARSADFENENHPPGGWWNWKEEKVALEVLLTAGEVMIARRQKFQRVYDLHQRVLPGWDDAQAPPIEEAHRYLALKAVRALGVALASWVPDYFRLPKKGNAARLEALAKDGRLRPVELKGFVEPAYVHPDQLALLEEAAAGVEVLSSGLRPNAAGRLEPCQTNLLSPFDPLVWDRQRARDLFGFDYSIECYLPAPKRRYGYFSLPILHRGALVGRLDPKAHRKEGLFEVKSIHLEPGAPVDEDLVSGLASALRRLADWHGTPQVVVRQSQPAELALRLEKALG